MFTISSNICSISIIKIKNSKGSKLRLPHYYYSKLGRIKKKMNNELCNLEHVSNFLTHPLLYCYH